VVGEEPQQLLQFAIEEGQGDFVMADHRQRRWEGAGALCCYYYYERRYEPPFATVVVDGQDAGGERVPLPLLAAVPVVLRTAVAAAACDRHRRGRQR